MSLTNLHVQKLWANIDLTPWLYLSGAYYFATVADLCRVCIFTLNLASCAETAAKIQSQITENLNYKPLHISRSLFSKLGYKNTTIECPQKTML